MEFRQIGCCPGERSETWIDGIIQFAQKSIRISNLVRCGTARFVRLFLLEMYLGTDPASKKFEVKGSFALAWVEQVTMNERQFGPRVSHHSTVEL